MDRAYDVIIVGASLAGASAAIELGKRKLKVALVDRASFPRRKPCGEGLSPLGMKQLERLGIRARILQAPHVPYIGYNVYVGRSHKFVRSPMPGGITIQRFDLDAAVLTAALEYSSVTPYLSNNVENIEGTEVYLSDRKLSAKKVVVACGGNSPLLNKVACQIKRNGPSRMGVSSLYKGEFFRTVNWITIIVKPTYEIYCTPLADGQLNISVLKRSKAPVNVHAIFNDSSLMRDIFEKSCFHGVRCGPLQGRTDIGNGRRVCHEPNIFLAGDAKEEFDPIGGMGMSHALSSGIQVAHQIIEKLSQTSKSTVAMDSHTRTVASMRRFTRLTYRTLIGAKYFPPLLSLPASTLGERCLKILFNDCL